jgi:hypothetical protein
VTRRLTLRREALSELTARDLAEVVGGVALTERLNTCLVSFELYGCNPSQPPHCTAVSL